MTTLILESGLPLQVDEVRGDSSAPVLSDWRILPRGSAMATTVEESFLSSSFEESGAASREGKKAHFPRF